MLLLKLRWEGDQVRILKETTVAGEAEENHTNLNEGSPHLARIRTADRETFCRVKLHVTAQTLYVLAV
jgi:hypothetical protein